MIDDLQRQDQESTVQRIFGALASVIETPGVSGGTGLVEIRLAGQRIGAGPCFDEALQAAHRWARRELKGIAVTSQ